MATYTYDYGDYRYTLNDSNYTASIEVLDITKSSYAAITSPITYDGHEYVVTNMPLTFGYCSSLTTAPEIPSSVTNMRYTFRECTSLTSAPEIPSGVKSLYCTFDGCSSLTSAPEIPSSVTDMEGTFSGCTSLTSAPEIPSGITSLSYTFQGCSALTSAPEIPSGVKSLYCTFQDCSALTSAPEIPSSVTDMNWTFYNCSSLTSASEIPSGVWNMSYTFYNCSSLTSAPDIPGSVTSMNSTFYGCSVLSGKLIVNNKPRLYSIIFGGEAIPSGETLKIYYIGTDTSAQSTWQSIANSYDRVSYPSISGGEQFNHGDYTYRLESSSPYNAFIKVIDTTKISYGAIESPITVNGTSISVTYMSSTFDGCSSLTSAPEIPSSVTYMWSTFYNCYALTSPPEIPSGVTNMDHTFDGCSSLTSAPEIPSSVTYMNYTFRRCSALTSAPEIPSSVTTSLNSTFQDCSALTSAPEIPSSVTDMSFTFDGCSSLTSAPEIPSSVTNMRCTFRLCYALTSPPEIPSGVTSMWSTFDGCSSLTSAPEIPGGVTNMSFTFRRCSALTSAPEIPSSVTDMWSTFQDCSSLNGNILVNNKPSDFSIMFSNTVNDIYIINNSSISGADTTWRTVASQYANVHYEADDLIKPQISLSDLIRVENIHDKSMSVIGEIIYASVFFKIYEGGKIPEGWYIREKNVGYGSLFVDSIDETLNTTWDENSEQTGKRIECWYDTNDKEQHSAEIRIYYDVLDENDIIRNISYVNVSGILSSSVPLVSYKAGAKGIAFGMNCPSDGFHVGMDAVFYEDVIFKRMAGAIQMYAGVTAPEGWLICDGRELSRIEYPELFDAIGTNWGEGNGTTTFNLPDLRGRSPVGQMDRLDSTSNNLFRTDYFTSDEENYLAYELYTLNGLTTSTTYTIQLWDVDIKHVGKTDTTIGLFIYWGGGSIQLCNWTANPNNDGITGLIPYHDHLGHLCAYAKHLTATFTTGTTAGAVTNQLNFYNSTPDVSNTRRMYIGKWMMNSGSTPLAWEPNEWLYSGRYNNVGSLGGIEANHISGSQSGTSAHGHGFTQPKTPNHTHTINNTNSTHAHSLKGYGAVIATGGSTAWRFGSSGTKTATGIISGDGAHTHGVTSSGGGVACSDGAVHTATAGKSANAHSNLSPYAVVNYIIATGRF